MGRRYGRGRGPFGVVAWPRWWYKGCGGRWGVGAGGVPTRNFRYGAALGAARGKADGEGLVPPRGNIIVVGAIARTDNQLKRWGGSDDGANTKFWFAKK